MNVKSYRPAIPASEEEGDIQTHVKHWLEPYLDSTGSWDPGVFLSDITELTSYSLINYDYANDAYNMHVLVHDWAATVISGQRVAAVKRTMFLLAVSINFDNTANELAYRRALELHVNSVLGHEVEPSPNDAGSFAEVYSCTGRWGRKEVLELLVVAALKEAVGDEHPDTLKSMNNLAFTYLHQGRHKEAEALQVVVLDARKRVLGNEHRDTLTSMNNLALTYSRQGRYKEAEALQVVVLDAYKRVLGDEHPGTLRGMDNLALTYSHQGRYKEAEALCKWWCWTHPSECLATSTPML